MYKFILDQMAGGFDSADDFLGKFYLSTRSAGSTAANNSSRILGFRSSCHHHVAHHPLDVGVLIFFLEQDVPLIHRILVHPPEYLHGVRRRV